MGSSCFHITRASHWSKSEEAPISQADIDRLADTDADLQLLNDFQGINPATGNPVGGMGSGLLWLGHPSGEPVLITISNGRLSVMDADDCVRIKLDQMATGLSASVQNDQ